MIGRWNDLIVVRETSDIEHSVSAIDPSLPVILHQRKGMIPVSEFIQWLFRDDVFNS